VKHSGRETGGMGCSQIRLVFSEDFQENNLGEVVGGKRIEKTGVGRSRRDFVFSKGEDELDP